MIEVKDLYALLAENEQKIADLQAENRVLNKLIDLDNAKSVETPCVACEQVSEEVVQQDESY